MQGLQFFFCVGWFFVSFIHVHFFFPLQFALQHSYHSATAITWVPNVAKPRNGQQAQTYRTYKRICDHFVHKTKPHVRKKTTQSLIQTYTQVVHYLLYCRSHTHTHKMTFVYVIARLGTARLPTQKTLRMRGYLPMAGLCTCTSKPTPQKPFYLRYLRILF